MGGFLSGHQGVSGSKVGERNRRIKFPSCAITPYEAQLVMKGPSIP